MGRSLFDEAVSASLHSPQGSPQQAEKDRAVELARSLLAHNTGITLDEARILARQLLRALALT